MWPLLEKCQMKVSIAATRHGVRHLNGMPPLKNGVQSRHAECLWHDNVMPAACHCMMQHVKGIPNPKVVTGNPRRTPRARHFSQVRCNVQCHSFQITALMICSMPTACRVACRAGMRHANGVSCRHASCAWSAKWHAFVHATCPGRATVRRGQLGVVQRASRMPSANFAEGILKGDSLPPGVA